MTIRVIVADDHPLFLAGVASLFSTISSTEIVATAGSSDELVEVLGKQTCDVLVTDFSMPGGRQQDGLRLIAYLLRTFPELRIIVITMPIRITFSLAKSLSSVILADQPYPAQQQSSTYKNNGLLTHF